MGKGSSAPEAPDPYKTAKAESQFNRLNTYGPGGSGTRYGFTNNSGEFQPGQPKKGQQAAVTYVESPAEKAIRLALEPASTSLVNRVVDDNITNMPGAPRVQNFDDLAKQIFEAGYARQKPAFDRENDRLMTNLQARGIPIAGKAFNDAYGQQQQSVNDALQQLTIGSTQAAGQEQTRQFGLDSAQRQGAIAELVAAMGGGYNPPNTVASGNAPGVNYSSLVSQKYNADVAAADAKAKQGTGLASTAGNIGAAMLMKCSVAFKALHGPMNIADFAHAVEHMPLHRWTYLPEADADPSVHVGPMAEDFQRFTGLGDGHSINVIDAFGVTLAALQAALQRIDRLEAMVIEGVREQ